MEVNIPGLSVPRPMATEASVVARLVRTRQENRQVLAGILCWNGVLCVVSVGAQSQLGFVVGLQRSYSRARERERESRAQVGISEVTFLCRLRRQDTTLQARPPSPPPSAEEGQVLLYRQERREEMSRHPVCVVETSEPVLMKTRKLRPLSARWM